MARSQAQVWGDRMRAYVQRACIELVLEINKELRKATPVDTGHARANWVASVGQPFFDEVDSDAAASAGVAQVLSFKLGDGVLYISNNVPYISALNNGHSEQAPPLFVEAAVDRAYARVQARYEGSIDFGRAGFQSEVGAAGAFGLAESYSPFAE